MAVEGITELVEALVANDYSRVTGTQESSWVDFKRSAYSVEGADSLRLTLKGKWELCKDVAAFANAEGGSIVIGFAEIDDPNRGVKVAGEVTPIAVSSVDQAHYKDVLNQGMYPSPDVEIRLIPDSSQDGLGVLLINIRPLGNGRHVVRKMVGEEGTQIEGLGIPLRHDDRTIWYNAERLHHELLSSSSSFSTAPTHSPTIARNIDEPINARAAQDAFLAELDWTGGQSTITIQILPEVRTGELTNFYDEVRRKVEQPSRIRPMGFDLTALGGTVEVVEGALVAAGNRDIALRLEPSGLCTLVILGSKNFLGWAMDRYRTSDEKLINSTVLVEATLSICLFAFDVIWQHGAQRVDYELSCRNLKLDNLQLAPYQPGTMNPSSRASSDDWNKSIAGTGDASEDAFNILKQIYALYGFPDSSIPYARDGKIEAEKIISLNLY